MIDLIAYITITVLYIVCFIFGGYYAKKSGRAKGFGEFYYKVTNFRTKKIHGKDYVAMSDITSIVRDFIEDDK